MVYVVVCGGMVHVHVVAWYGVVVWCGSCACDAVESHITSPDLTQGWLVAGH